MSKKETVCLATFKLKDIRVRYNRPVVKENTHTIWVTVMTQLSRFSKPVLTEIKRHKIKHGVKFNG